MRHPDSRRDDHSVERLHGVSVADPYRWLEDQESPEVADWVAAQQAHADAYLASLPQRATFRRHLAEIWDHPRVGAPWCRGQRWFQFRNAGTQEQPVLWTAASPEEEGRVLLDPTELSEDGTVSLAGVAVTDDGGRLAYGTSDGGSDWTTWHVRDVTTGIDLSDTVPWSKFSGAAWLPDGSGFFYGAFAEPAAGQALSASNRGQQLRFHRLGTDAAADPVVHERPDAPDWGFAPQVTDDGMWLVVNASRGTDPRSRLLLAALTDDDGAPLAGGDVQVREWLDDFDAEYRVIGAAEGGADGAGADGPGRVLLVTTDRDAPNGRILAVSTDDAGTTSDVLAETDEPLLTARVVGGRLVVLRMRDAVHRLLVHDLDGGGGAEVALPDLASVGEMTGRPRDAAAHLTCSSWTRSPAVYRLEAAAPALVEVKPPAIEVPDVITEQVMVESTDGARVPMFLLRPAGAERSGSLPTILYGYGGFSIPLTPEFRLWWTAWLAHGGAIAVGCFRGGSEYGRTWHDDGRLANKAHTFDDAQACLRWLVEEGWSSPANLGITGGSNGGLTTMATVIRDPASVAAAVPEVGVLDLLRFHRFTIGWAWTSDYGDPEDPEDFPRILGMSPLHTLVDGECYPPTMITTADRDDRVVPAHSFKFTAALQHAQGCDNPVVARIDTSAGHGAGTPTSKLIAARADVLAFFAEHLGLAVRPELEGQR